VPTGFLSEVAISKELRITIEKIVRGIYSTNYEDQYIDTVCNYISS
jgi:hypothetical protein